MPYPDDLNLIVVTTSPSCLLVKTAELREVDIAEKVLRRFHESVFLYGRPVDADDQAALALDGLADLDRDNLLDDAKTAAVLGADWQETRPPNDYVRAPDKQELHHRQEGMMTS